MGTPLLSNAQVRWRRTVEKAENDAGIGFDQVVHDRLLVRGINLYEVLDSFVTLDLKSSDLGKIKGHIQAVRPMKTYQRSPALAAIYTRKVPLNLFSIGVTSTDYFRNKLNLTFKHRAIRAILAKQHELAPQQILGAIRESVKRLCRDAPVRCTRRLEETHIETWMSVLLVNYVAR